MRKPALVFCGVLCVTVGLTFLMGCDLLGLGPKKKDELKKQQESVVVSAPVAPGALPANVLVRIGNWTLTADDFNEHINLLKQQYPDLKENDPGAKNAILEQLVRQQLLVKEAEDSDLGNTKSVKEAVEDFRKELLVQEMASRLTKEVLATENDARSYYDANKEKFAEPVKWTIRQIVVSDEASAKSILVQVLQGGDFAQIAKAQSKAANAAEGGKINAFETGKAPFEAMQTAISNLDGGGISGVFKGPEGFYIVKVESKTGGTLKPFSEFKEKLIYYLTQQKQQAVLFNHLKELAEKNKPEFNKDLVGQVIGK